MRTTIQLADDVAAALDEFRRESRLGVSDAINQLIRRGLSAPRRRPAFKQRTAAVGLHIAIDDVGEAVELLEGSDSR